MLRNRHPAQFWVTFWVTTDVPHFSIAFWPPTSGGIVGGVDAGWDVKQVQDLLLQVGQPGVFTPVLMIMVSGVSGQ